MIAVPRRQKGESPIPRRAALNRLSVSPEPANRLNAALILNALSVDAWQPSEGAVSSAGHRVPIRELDCLLLGSSRNQRAWVQSSSGAACAAHSSPFASHQRTQSRAVLPALKPVMRCKLARA